jgi:hypothetical protein
MSTAPPRPVESCFKGVMWRYCPACALAAVSERPSRALLAVDRYMLPPCLFALWSVGVRFQLVGVLSSVCLLVGSIAT